MHGQRYDRAAALKKFKPLLKKISRELYTHCVSHSLNLCLSDATKIQEIQYALDVISECCSFLHCKLNEQQFLKIIFWNRNLLLILQNKRHESVLFFKEFLEPIVAALEQ